MTRSLSARTLRGGRRVSERSEEERRPQRVPQGVAWRGVAGPTFVRGVNWFFSLGQGEGQAQFCAQPGGRGSCNGEWSRGKAFRLARPVPKSLGATVSRRDARSFGVGNRSTEKTRKNEREEFSMEILVVIVQQMGFTHFFYFFVTQRGGLPRAPLARSSPRSRRRWRSQGLSGRPSPPTESPGSLPR